MKSKIKMWMSILLMVVNVFTLVGCGNSSINDTKEAAQKKCIVDMAGVTVELPSEVDKVICTSQNAMEFMVAMGVEDKLVGVHKSIANHTWSPEYIHNLDSIELYGYNPSAEAVYESEADLVIMKDESAAEELRNAGITAITFKYDSKEQMYEAVRLLGQIFGENAERYAEKWIKYYKETETEIKDKISALSNDQKKRVYFINASVSLHDGGLTSTVGGNSIIAEWFNTIGVDLVTKDENDIATINEEKILQMNPEVIVISGWSENTRKEQLLADDKWKDVAAVKNNQIYIMPVGFVSFERYAVEAPLLLKYSLSVIYPELFKYDAVNDFDNFFNEYFAIDLSEEKIDYILKGLSPDGARMD